LISVCAELSAQQKPLFSNYWFNQFYYNPALAGNTEFIDFKALGRFQWVKLNGAPQTQTFSANSRLKKMPLGIGGNIYHDATGPIRNIGTNLSLSYSINLNKGGELSAGISGGIIHFNLGNNIIIKDLDDNAIKSAQESKTLPDFSLGIYYKVKGFYTSFSVPQLFQSKIDLSTPDPLEMNKLVRHYFWNVGYRIDAGKKFQIEPSLLLKAVKASPVQVDINLKAIFKKIGWLGMSYRTDDAVSVMGGFFIKDNLQIGYSYDITTSVLNTVSNGTHEILLGYKLFRKKDTDGDGVYDKVDKCPNVAGLKENMGCPQDSITLETLEVVKIDKDNDGVPDEDDKCPNTVGTPENDGCPIVDDKQKEVVDKALANLEFEYNKDKVKDYSLPYLDRLAELLSSKKDWKIKMAGHTDNTGNPEYNMNLSRDRVQSVKFYLLSKGVNKEQVIAEYFGDTKPIAPNDTEDGRAQNRRVEMEFVFD
jgi:type IX secretion system PorP/SprF family membrane protein